MAIAVRWDFNENSSLKNTRQMKTEIGIISEAVLQLNIKFWLTRIEENLNKPYDCKQQ